MLSTYSTVVAGDTRSGMRSSCRNKQRTVVEKQMHWDGHWAPAPAARNDDSRRNASRSGGAAIGFGCCVGRVMARTDDAGAVRQVVAAAVQPFGSSRARALSVCGWTPPETAAGTFFRSVRFSADFARGSVRDR